MYTKILVAVENSPADQAVLQHIEQLVEVHGQGPVERAFRQAYRLRRPLCEPQGKLSRALLELGGGYDPVHQPDTQSIFRAHLVAEERHLERLAESHKPR